MKKIESEKPIDGALWRQVMAGNGKGSDFLSQTDNKRDAYNGQIFQAAGGNNGRLAYGPSRIASDGDGGLNRNNRGDGSGIDGQAEGFSAFESFQEGVGDENLNRTEGGFWHDLQGQRVAGGKAVVGVGDQCQALVPHHGSVDFVPVLAVDQQVPSFGQGNVGVHLIDMDQQPLAVKSPPDFLDGFTFHGYCHYTTEEHLRAL